MMNELVRRNAAWISATLMATAVGLSLGLVWGAPWRVVVTVFLVGVALAAAPVVAQWSPRPGEVTVTYRPVTPGLSLNGERWPMEPAVGSPAAEERSPERASTEAETVVISKEMVDSAEGEGPGQSYFGSVRPGGPDGS